MKNQMFISSVQLEFAKERKFSNDPFSVSSRISPRWELPLYHRRKGADITGQEIGQVAGNEIRP
jgi:hypothetical protein